MRMCRCTVGQSEAGGRNEIGLLGCTAVAAPLRQSQPFDLDSFRSRTSGQAANMLLQMFYSVTDIVAFLQNNFMLTRSVGHTRVW